MTEAILKYPGAKWRLAPWLHRYAPVCTRVVDAYCGSGAFALTLPYRPAHLVLNDCDEHIPRLFRTLREQPDALIRAVALTPWSRAEYLSVTGPAGRILEGDNDLETVRRYLVATWQAHGTTLTTRNGWRHKGTGKKRRVGQISDTYEVWAQLPHRLAAVVERLKDAEIECLPALTVIGRYASEDTLIYADPPYTRRHGQGERKRLYRHEMTDADHVELLTALDAHPGPVLLSGYDSDLYAERLAHWRRVETKTQAEKGNSRIESLWLNQVAVDQLGYGPLFDEVSR